MSEAHSISIRGLSKAYGSLGVFTKLSVSFPAGVTSAIVGTSGSGKTTLLQMVNGLERPDGGEIRVFGETVPTTQLEAFRQRIGYAVQGAGLFPHLTAKQNVTLVARLNGWSEQTMDQRCDELLDDMELPRDVADRLPRQLSGGQQQRIGLCRALMLNPQLLLLDEPFSAVDPVTRLGLYQQFEQVQRRKAVSTLLVTHDLREARRLARFLVILDAGQVAQFGTPEHVLSHPATPFVETLIESQL